MTNELTQTFAFEAYDIRIIIENGEPLFNASDVCKALGYLSLIHISEPTRH